MGWPEDRYVGRRWISDGWEHVIVCIGVVWRASIRTTCAVIVMVMYTGP